MRELRLEQLSDNCYTGPEYEGDLLSRMPISNPSYRKELLALQEKVMGQGYRPKRENSLPFREAVEITKRFQPGDPTNPEQDFAREMRLALAEKLGLDSDEQMDQLKFFTSVRGPLDLHGIDAFFTFSYLDNEGRTKECMVSLDVTRNPKKDDSRADVLIAGDVPDPSDAGFNEKEYLAIIEKYAAQCAGIIKEKINQGGAGFSQFLH